MAARPCSSRRASPAPVALPKGECMARSNFRTGAPRRAPFTLILGAIAIGSLALGLGGTVAPAAAKELKLMCPGEGGDTYRFKDRRTKEQTEIKDPQLKALAEQACETPLGATEESGPVTITNKQSGAIYVGFTTIDHKPGPITWGAGCSKSGNGAKIAAGATCNATVLANASPSRFCASGKSVPADCFNAQQNHQTMVETNFEPSTNGGCFNKGNCVWFDISVIPSTCTDELWKKNQCAGTGGASYNFPVQIACGAKAKPTYVCQGPPTGKWGNSNYPGNCGDPNSICQSGPKCQNAYFYPMFVPPENKYQPNTVCLSGQTLAITFLAGK
jgi:hypothetical protein